MKDPHNRQLVCPDCSSINNEIQVFTSLDFKTIKLSCCVNYTDKNIAEMLINGYATSYTPDEPKQDGNK